MCTVVLRVDPNGPLPLAYAGNRDEMIDRPWDPPGPWWADLPDVAGGRDRLAGGTWLGVNRHGVVAGVLNRTGSLGPQPGKRSRGELPLLALRHSTAAAAAAAIATTDAGDWRSYNLVLADRTGAFFVRGTGAGRPAVLPLGAGVHVIASSDPNDPEHPRVARHLPRFRAAPPPSPDDWDGWRAILADRSGPADSEINVPPDGTRPGFGTVSAAMLFLPATGAPSFLFAPGPPDRHGFAPVPWPG